MKRWQWLAKVLEREGLSCDKLHCSDRGKISEALSIQAMPSHGPSSRWSIRVPTEEDEPACFSLFEKAFGAPVSADLWRWKYGGGRGRSIIALRDQKIIAHYGSVSRRISRLGQPDKAVQISDVMVDPTERAVMTRSGAFLQVARAYQEYFLGFEAVHDFGFGFPNRRHMVLAHRLGLYDEVDRLVEMEWSTQSCTKPQSTLAEVLEENQLEPSVINALWGKMQCGLNGRILIVRDAEYWRYRYVENPQSHYVMLAIREKLTRNIIGLVVLRREENEVKLLDLLAPSEHFSLLVKHALAQSLDWGASIMRAWITQGCSHMFETPESRLKTTEIVIPLNSYFRMHATAEIRNRWFLMMGDTDFL